WNLCLPTVSRSKFRNLHFENAGASWDTTQHRSNSCHHHHTGFALIACENKWRMPCVFCRATDNLTDEHVFPAFSGANLVVPNGSCKPCNNICSKFEQKIAGELATTRHIFEIQDR